MPTWEVKFLYQPVSILRDGQHALGRILEVTEIASGNNPDEAFINAWNDFESDFHGTPYYKERYYHKFLSGLTAKKITYSNNILSAEGYLEQKNKQS